jgi:hypothetical protein
MGEGWDNLVIKDGYGGCKERMVAEVAKWDMLTAGTYIR